MLRTIVGFALFLGIVLFVRHQYQLVIGQITMKKPQPMSIFRTVPQESRIKCIMCGGTGRLPAFNYGADGSDSRPCPTCNGTGWVDNPMFGR
jgi:hypothetical protein